jgi:purine-binding chemotaxis protein CheW
VRLLLFVIDDVQYAVRSEAIAEIIRAVAVTPLPSAPAVIEGIIDVRGRIAPVFDLRLRFGRPSRAVTPSDHFILARATTRLAALHVDRVLDLIDVDDSSVDSIASQVSPASPVAHIAGVALLSDGMALIHDVDTFLSAAEAETLDTALDASAGAGRSH